MSKCYGRTFKFLGHSKAYDENYNELVHGFGLPPSGTYSWVCRDCGATGEDTFENLEDSMNSEYEALKKTKEIQLN